MVLATVPEAPPTSKEPTRDFLSGANFGERAEGGWIEIQGERFVVSVELLSRWHSKGPVGQMSESCEAPTIPTETAGKEILPV